MSLKQANHHGVWISIYMLLPSLFVATHDIPDFSFEIWLKAHHYIHTDSKFACTRTFHYMLFHCVLFHSILYSILFYPMLYSNSFYSSNTHILACAVISRSNIKWYCIQHRRYQVTTHIRFQTHKICHILLTIFQSKQRDHDVNKFEYTQLNCLTLRSMNFACGFILC